MSGWLIMRAFCNESKPDASSENRQKTFEKRQHHQRDCQPQRKSVKLAHP
jgi:hypothetical protein